GRPAPTRRPQSGHRARPAKSWRCAPTSRAARPDPPRLDASAAREGGGDDPAGTPLPAEFRCVLPAGSSTLAALSGVGSHSAFPLHRSGFATPLAVTPEEERRGPRHTAANGREDRTRAAHLFRPRHRGRCRRSAPAVAFVSEGRSRLFYPFVAFAIVESGVRWGLRRTLMVTAASAALWIAMIALWVPDGIIFYLMRPVYLMVIGYLVGYLGEERLALENDVRTLEANEQRLRIAR